MVEADLWSGRRGDGDAARLLARVPPETLREDREEEPSGWSWLRRLNGNCAFTLTIFLWGVGGGERVEESGETDPSFERTTDPRHSLSFWWSITRGCGLRGGERDGGEERGLTVGCRRTGG